MHLGYSRSGSAGSGIGLGLSKAIASTAKVLIDKGIINPELFELIGLLEEGVGADRISDMVVRIILSDLLAYSQRVTEKLKVQSHEVLHSGVKYRVPVDAEDKKPVILVPREILRHLPMAFDWQDIDIVCEYNAALRVALMLSSARRGRRRIMNYCFFSKS